MWKNDERVLEVSGTRLERAQAQGAHFREHMPQMFREGFSDFVPRWIPSFVVRFGLWVLGKLYLRRHRSLHEQAQHTHHRTGLADLARAAGVAPATLYGFHAVEVETSCFGFSMGCTSLAFSPGITSDGAPRLTYNHDFPPAFEQFLFVRRNAPAEGYRSVSVTYPCLMGAINGVNEHGLAVSVDQAFATDIDRNRPALFVTMLVQECLDTCRSVDEAVALLQRSPIVAGCMVSLVDAEGDRAAVELSPTRCEVRRAADDEVLYTFNNYRVRSMREVEVPVGAVTTGLFGGYDLHRCNLTRERRFLQRVRGGEVWDDAAIQGLMSDHDEGTGDSNTICRHDDPLAETILNTIANPREKSLKVLWGRPCAKRHAIHRVLEPEAVLAG